MADTKKEHYVPRCYLKNFILGNGRIQVFDKYKVQVRSQNIMDVAMENYFYDIKFDDLLKHVDENKKIKSDLMDIVGTEEWEDVLVALDEKHIEKHFACAETIYSTLLQKIIEKSYDGNQWVIDNCRACSAMEKEFMSLFIAIQIIRTKTFRDTLSDTMQKMYQTLAYKMQMHEENALPKDAFKVEVNKDFVKLQHSNMILDEEVAVQMAETLNNHIWVMYVNKTDCSFYTSDNPVANIPHKFDKYRSYGGLKSEGIEIVFPITPKLMLAMYDRKRYDKVFSDRQFAILSTIEEVEYYNRVQVINSNRCVFSGQSNFGLAEKLCKEHPKLQAYQSRVEVG